MENRPAQRDDTSREQREQPRHTEVPEVPPLPQRPEATKPSQHSDAAKTRKLRHDIKNRLAALQHKRKLKKLKKAGLGDEALSKVKDRHRSKDQHVVDLRKTKRRVLKGAALPPEERRKYEEQYAKYKKERAEKKRARKEAKRIKEETRSGKHGLLPEPKGKKAQEGEKPKNPAEDEEKHGQAPLAQQLAGLKIEQGVENSQRVYKLDRAPVEHGTVKVDTKCVLDLADGKRKKYTVHV